MKKRKPIWSNNFRIKQFGDKANKLIKIEMVYYNGIIEMADIVVDWTKIMINTTWELNCVSNDS